MDIVINIIFILAGLGILLYGMTIFSHALEIGIGSSLNHKFLSVAKNPLKSSAFSAGLTFITQKSTLVSSMIMNYCSVGTITLRQSLPMVIGINIGNAASVLILFFQGLNITTFLTLACFIGALLNLFGKSEKTKLLSRCFMGFGMLFLGMELIGLFAQNLFQIPEIYNFLSSVAYPIVIITFALVISLLTTSTFCTLTILSALAGLNGTGPIPVETAVLGMLIVPVGTSIIDFIYTAPGQDADAKKIALYRIILNIISFIIFSLLSFTGVYTWLFNIVGQNTIFTFIIVHIAQMLSSAIFLPLRTISENLLNLLIKNKRKKVQTYDEFVIPQTTLDNFSTGYIAVLNSVRKIFVKNQELHTEILEKLSEKSELRGIKGRLQAFDKILRITNNTILRLSTKANEDDMQKINVLLNILSDSHDVLGRIKKLSEYSKEIAKNPKSISHKEINSIQNINIMLTNSTTLICDMIELLVFGQPIEKHNLNDMLNNSKKTFAYCQKLRRQVYLEYKKHGNYPETNIYFSLIQNFEDVNNDLENIAIKVGILQG